LQTLNPQLSSEWHLTKNGVLTPFDFVPASNKKVWWLGKCGHEWETVISSRNKGVGCPYCAGKKVLCGYNDLKTINPQLAEQWHPTKNGQLKPSDVTRSSNKKVWWMCSQGHEWGATVNKRSAGRNCPYCAKKARSH
jgi:hypothetical protein